MKSTPALCITILVVCLSSIVLTVIQFAMGRPLGWMHVVSLITISFLAGFQAHTLLSLYTPATDGFKKG